MPCQEHQLLHILCLSSNKTGAWTWQTLGWHRERCHTGTPCTGVPSQEPIRHESRPLGFRGLSWMGTVGGGTGGSAPQMYPQWQVQEVFTSRKKLPSESACSSMGIRGQSSPQSSPHPRLLWVRMGRLGVAHPSSDMGGHASIRVP